MTSLQTIQAAIAKTANDLERVANSPAQYHVIKVLRDLNMNIGIEAKRAEEREELLRIQ